MKQKIISLLFLVVVFGFFIVSFIIPDREFSYNENRELAQRPELNVETIFSGKFMEEFESYVTDQVYLRDEFVTFSTNIKLLLGQKEINGVYFSNNYFVEKFQETDIDKELLEKTKGFISEFLKNHSNAKIAIIPTAGGVVEGLYPKYSDNINQGELINEIYDAVGKEQSIDVFKNLENHQKEDIYYRTDHHWTTLGAYYGYEAIIDAFGGETIGLENYTREVIDDQFHGTIQSKVNYDIGYDSIIKYVPKFETSYSMILNEDKNTETSSLYDESKLTSKEKYAVFIGGNNAANRIKNESVDNGKKLLIIKDSYSHCLTPFIVNNYSEVLLLDMRYFMGGIDTFLDGEEIDDVLIMYNLKNLVEDRNLIRLNK